MTDTHTSAHTKANEHWQNRKANRPRQVHRFGPEGKAIMESSLKIEGRDYIVKNGCWIIEVAR